MDAQNAPTRRSRETVTTDFKVGQQSPIDITHGIDHEQIIDSLDTPLIDEYAKALQFNEEVLTIMVMPSSEKHAPKVVQCWVNGRGAEVFMNGRWLEIGCFPVGIRVITKRKFVEVLLRCKTDAVSTMVIERNGEDPQNVVDRVTSHRVPLTIIEDKNPMGAEWVARILAEG